MAVAQTLVQDKDKDDLPVGFLKEDNGNYSTMRLMSFIALFAAIAFGGMTMVKPELKETGLNLTFSFLVAAFAPKAVQKFAEQKIPDSSTTD